MKTAECPSRLGLQVRKIAVALIALATVTAGYAQSDYGQAGSDATATQRRDAGTDGSIPTLRSQSAERRATDAPRHNLAVPRRAPPVPGEFELYVRQLAGQSIERDGPSAAQRKLTESESSTELASDGRPLIRRLGAELANIGADQTSVEFNPLVPPDYIVKPGDELQLTLWGSVDAQLRLPVDQAGRISVPRVGAVQVSGVRYADVPDLMRRRVAQVYRNFDLAVSLSQLRGVRVYVTGFVERPGAYTVSSLSTITQALFAAGGPSAAGSFRAIELRRAGKIETRLDLYDLLLKGERSNDRVVQADDTIHVGPAVAQVALIGSVNRPAIFDLLPGETVADVLRMAGGFNTVADTTRLSVERLEDRRTVRVAQLELPRSEPDTLKSGDVLRAFSTVAASVPVEQQNKRVRIEGEVLRPGDYLMPPNSTIADAIATAGGLTRNAFVFGTDFRRETVRATQQINYERALRDLEVDYTKAATSQRVASAEEAAAQAARGNSTSQLIDKLRGLRPTGRVVLQIEPDARELPALVLEDRDTISIPSKPTSIGVFGSVYNSGSYLYDRNRSAGEILALAGGPTTTADAKSAFVIRANGSVVSGRQQRGWFGGGGIENVPTQPGDTIFVPDEVNRTTWMQDLKDWSQIIYQLGLGAAAVSAVSK